MPKHKATANPKYHKAMVELRRSNASGIHLDKRTKRTRTRNAKLRKEVSEHAE
jgi:hypothetical protein